MMNRHRHSAMPVEINRPTAADHSFAAPWIKADRKDRPHSGGYSA